MNRELIVAGEWCDAREYLRAALICAANPLPALAELIRKTREDYPAYVDCDARELAAVRVRLTQIFCCTRPMEVR